MPFRRRKRFRRKRRRRRTRLRRPRRMPAVDPERKFLDASITLAPGTGGVIIHNNPIAEGVSSAQRNGARALFLSFQFKATMARDGAQGSGFATTLRYIVLIDKRPNQTLLTPGDLLSAAATPIESPYQLPNNNRFTVFVDKRVVLSEFMPTRTISFYRRFRLKTTWNAATGNITALTQGALYTLWFSDIPGLIEPVVNSISRLRWVG